MKVASKGSSVEDVWNWQILLQKSVEVFGEP